MIKIACAPRGSHRPGGEHVHNTYGADADHMSESGLGVRVLAVAGLTAELGGELADLADTGGADGVTHGQKPTGRADRDPASDVELTCFEIGGGVARLTDPDGFDVQQLFDGEGVVEFDDVKVAGRQAGLAERLSGSIVG